LSRAIELDNTVSRGGDLESNTVKINRYSNTNTLEDNERLGIINSDLG
jgi:hypothetical protein